MKNYEASIVGRFYIFSTTSEARAKKFELLPNKFTLSGIKTLSSLTKFLNEIIKKKFSFSNIFVVIINIFIVKNYEILEKKCSEEMKKL